MSRLAKKPIVIPEGVNVAILAGDVTVKGPLGELSIRVRPEISVVSETEGIVISTKKGGKEPRSLVGTYASHVRNMIKGVKEKYTRKLILEGVGYKSEGK